MKYSRITKLLHLGVASTISLQLLLSLVMEAPHAGRTRSLMESIGYDLHEFVGLAALTFISLHWLVFLSGNAYKGLGHFFPWFSSQRRQSVWREAKALMHLQLGEVATQDQVAGALQGLGLLIGLMLAVSGGVIFWGMAADGSGGPMIHLVKEFHGFWGPVMWGYLGIHLGATLLHRVLGHDEVTDIFRVGSS